MPLSRTKQTQRSIRPRLHILDADNSLYGAMGHLFRSAGIAPIFYATPLALLTAAPAMSAGCILCDVAVPSMDGFELLERLMGLSVAVPIVVLTAHANVPMVVRAMKLGVVDFLEKPCPDKVLLDAVRRAVSHRRATVLGAQVEDATRRIAALSPRERTVLNALVGGNPNKVIAYDLGISIRTVQVHRARMMERLGVHSLAEATCLAVMARVGIQLR